MAKKIIKNFLNYCKKAKVELVLLICLLLADLLVKQIVSVSFDYAIPKKIINNFVYVTYIHNYAAAFGSSFGLSNIFGQQGTKVFFIVFTIVMLGIFCFFLYRWKNNRLWARIMIALIVAGGIGNLYDRMVFGYVRDFVHIVFFGADLWFFGTDFAIFNLADSFLSIGIVGFCIYLLFMYEKDKKRIAQICLKEENKDKEYPNINTKQGVITQNE